MNTLHMHSDYIVSKLNEIIDLIKQPAGNPKSDLFHAIIAIIICATIIIVTRYAIKRFFDWKIKAHENENNQKNDESVNQVTDKEFELKKEYQAKILEFLKEETNSYSKLLKEIDKKKKEKEEKLKEIYESIKDVKTKLGNSAYVASTSYPQIYDQLSSIKEKVDDYETPVSTEKTDWYNWDKFHDSLKQSEYLKALTYFIEGDVQDKGKALFDYLTSQQSNNETNLPIIPNDGQSV